MVPGRTTDEQINRLEDLPDLQGRSALVRATLDLPLEAESAHPLAALRLRRLDETVSYLRARGASVTVFGDTMAAGPESAALRSLLEGLGAEAVLGDRQRSVEDPGLLADLVSANDVFVNDSFQWCYLPLPSLLFPAGHLTSAAGRGLEHDLVLGRALLHEPVRPLAAVLGGSNTLLRLHGLAGLILRADHVLVGGAMSLPLLEAVGRRPSTGLPQSFLDECRSVIGMGERVQHLVHLPTDLVVRRADGSVGVVAVSDPADGQVIDIGPATARRFAEVVAGADTVLWTGPLGAVEEVEATSGTASVSEGLAAATDRLAVVGGDRLVEWLWSENRLGPDLQLVTATDALLEYIKTGTLPGLAPLLHR